MNLTVESDYKKSLMMAMSLSGNELFHSNVWAWILKRCPWLCGKIFANMKGDPINVVREEHGRDITIWAEYNGEKEAYVIENKFKAIPNKDQLKRYEEGIKSTRKRNCAFGGGVLVGVVEPSWMGDLEDHWRFISYKHMLRYIKESLLKCKLSDNELVVMRWYVDVFGALIAEIEKFLKNTAERMCNINDIKEYAEVRLGDLFAKINASVVAAKLLRLAKDSTKIQQSVQCKSSTYNLEIASDFFHGEALVCAYYVKKGKASVERLIGLELQGGEYHICAEVKRLSDDKLIYLYKSLANKGWFDEDNTKGRIRGKKCEYKKFGKFIYRSRTMDDLSIDTIWCMMEKDLQKAIVILPVLDDIS